LALYDKGRSGPWKCISTPKYRLGLYLVENVVTDCFEDIAFTRETLDRRYDDMEGGRVKPIPGEEVFARLRAKSAARRTERR
jgi:hypothetical protein